MNTTDTIWTNIQLYCCINDYSSYKKTQLQCTGWLMAHSMCRNTFQKNSLSMKGDKHIRKNTINAETRCVCLSVHMLLFYLEGFITKPVQMIRLFCYFCNQKLHKMNHLTGWWTTTREFVYFKTRYADCSDSLKRHGVSISWAQDQSEFSLVRVSASTAWSPRVSSSGTKCQ